MIKNEGIFCINKPKGISSFEVVKKIREATKIKKVGHAGTLDPLASGVLIVAVGKDNTKKIPKIMAQEKEYIAEIKLGEFSETDDAEGKKTKVKVTDIPDMKKVRNVVSEFIGQINQTPPKFSAIKVNGKRAYKLAREGKNVNLKPRKVLIKDIEILGYKYPDLVLKITCGKGVYIRSLARDIGEKLKTGGYIRQLKRTRIGEFKIEDALSLENLTQVK